MNTLKLVAPDGTDLAQCAVLRGRNWYTRTV